MLFNAPLSAVFESDVVPRIPTPEGVRVLNIEADAVQHKAFKSKRFETLRDEHLVSTGVSAERFNTPARVDLSDEQQHEWVRQRVLEVLPTALDTEPWKSCRVDTK